MRQKLALSLRRVESPFGTGGVAVRWLRVASVVSLAMALLACTGQPAPLHDKAMSQIASYIGKVPLPSGPVAGHPWAKRACQTGHLEADVLACVDGVAVTRAQFDAVLPLYPPGTPARAIVAALVDEEVLAAAAAKTLWGDWLQEPLQRILVGHILYDQFERKLTPDAITEDDVKTAWNTKVVRQTYIHPGVYTVTDAQIICCSGNYKSCGESADANRCIDELAPTARALADYLAANPPATAQEMHGKVGADPRFTKAAVVDLSFFYDPAKPYAEQKGYALMVERFTEAVLKLKPGEMTRDPVRSEYGWHVIRLENAVAPATKDISDPEVLADLKKNLVPALREPKVVKLVGELGKSAGVSLYMAGFDQN